VQALPGEKLNLALRECAIDNTSIDLGANAILPQLHRPKPGSVDPVAPYKLCQLVDLLHLSKILALLCLFSLSSPVY
jgi:hypothetical protein